MLRKLLVGATSTALLLGGASVAVADVNAKPSDCDARWTVLSSARAEFKTAVALAETRAHRLGLSGSLIASAKKDLEGGLTAGEKAGLMVHLPEVLAARGGGSEDDLKLALRVEAAANELARAERATRPCGSEPATSKPAPTTTPAPTTKPAPFTDLDCKDFPLADGRTAQQVLDSTPDDDPHGLDADKDRIACEPGQDTAPDGSDIADRDEPGHVEEVAVPQGGVNTGGGPA